MHHDSIFIIIVAKWWLPKYLSMCIIRKGSLQMGWVRI